jgi:hypothetical protein
VVSAERGGGEHRFGHVIYAGSLSLGISDSRIVHVVICQQGETIEVLYEIRPGSLISRVSGSMETYLRIG